MTDYVDIDVISGLGNPLPTSKLNDIINNQKYFRTPPQLTYTRALAAGNYTVTTTFSDIDGTNLAGTLTTTGNPVLAILQAGKIGNSAAGTISLDLLVDGVSQSNLGLGIIVVSGATEFKPVNLVIPIFGLAAGAHTFRWQWKTSTGTATLYAAQLIQMWVKEW